MAWLWSHSTPSLPSAVLPAVCTENSHLTCKRSCRNPPHSPPESPLVRYEGSAHSLHGYLVLLLSLILSAVEIAAFFLRLYAFFTAPSKLTLSQFWHSVVLGQQDTCPSPSQYSGLVSEDPEEYDDIKLTSPHVHRNSDLSEHTVFDADSPQSTRHSDDTLRDTVVTHVPLPKQPLPRRIAQAAYATLERFLVFAAFGMVISGIVIYTGGCRDSYINGCLAHLISKEKKDVAFS